ncbi:hypothetical protein THTE_3395 [Thermogutta terrifontis]|uniref:Uncharacterized protein n=1 Tax=Thermogutta terrifontis TaxID=1331910 RepID=A0A286RJ63_9BACT|nr:hypothetical protein THTE_3395 [Thermogutta terrifontis]
MERARIDLGEFPEFGQKESRVTLFKKTLNDVETKKWTRFMFARSTATNDKSSIE